MDELKVTMSVVVSATAESVWKRSGGLVAIWGCSGWGRGPLGGTCCTPVGVGDKRLGAWIELCIPSSSSCESDISMSSSRGCSRVVGAVVGDLGGGLGALGGVGEARWVRVDVLVFLGIVWGLPKVGGKNWAPTGGGAWCGVLGGEGEVGALRLLLTGSIGVGSIVWVGWVLHVVYIY